MAKIVFITGATSGIGKACAEKFAAAGCDLVLTGRRKELLNEVANSLQSKYSVKVHSAVFDVQVREEVFNAVKNLPEEFTEIDILINNAGLALGRAPFDEADLDDWDTMMHTNVNGLLYVSKALLPILKNSSEPHILNIGSTAGKEVYENGNVYCASKFAVGAISQAMRIDLLKYGIKVTSVNPGAAETNFSLVRYKGDEEKAAGTYEGYKALSAGDVADAVFYCCTLPAHVCVNDLTLTCTAQANSFYTKKEN